MRLAADHGARRSPLLRTAALACCLCAGAAHARAQDAQEPEGEGPAPWPAPAEPGEVSPAPGSAAPPPYASWRWRRVFSHPRIGGRLTAIAVDPTDPARIVVGSEEGTVFQSFDGGATWDERPLYPFVTTDRSLGLQVPGLPRLGGFIAPSLQVLVFPPFRRQVGILGMPYAGYDPTMPRRFGPLPLNAEPVAEGITAQGEAPTSTFPEFMQTYFVRTGAGAPDLLASVTRSRRGETQPVRAIQFCPGNDFPLLVATKRNLYGSADGGLTYIRLYAIPGRVDLHWVACAEDAPNRVALATSFGLYRSRDGGLTFDLETSGWPGAAVTAVAYGQGESLFVANGSLLFRGDPDSAQGQVMVYPDYENNDTAPWRTIRWIEVTESNQIWLATDDGVRGSLDGGDGWTVPARLLFSRRPIPQVVVGNNEVGGERVAVMVGPGPAGVQGAVYASDDGGESWFPFFQGITRRSLQRMAAARGPSGGTPRWYVAAGHEVWATLEPGAERGGFVGDPAVAGWARAELQRQPPLQVVTEIALERTGLGAREVQSFTDGLSSRAWIPRIDLVFDLSSTDELLAWAEQPTPRFADEQSRTVVWQLFVQGTWYFRDLALVNEEIDSFQNRVHELRRQVIFAVEDAWRERTQHLRRIAGGRLDDYQAEVLRMRIETIDALLETWLGGPMSEVARRGTRRDE